MKRFLYIGILILVIAGGIIIFYKHDSGESQADAIRQAKTYNPSGICTDSLTPAVHVATGARYTFPTGCIAPGWERAQ